jgi:hypothetical protein
MLLNVFCLVAVLLVAVQSIPSNGVSTQQAAELALETPYTCGDMLHSMSKGTALARQPPEGICNCRDNIGHYYDQFYVDYKSKNADNAGRTVMAMLPKDQNGFVLCTRAHRFIMYTGSAVRFVGNYDPQARFDWHTASMEYREWRDELVMRVESHNEHTGVRMTCRLSSSEWKNPVSTWDTWCKLADQDSTLDIED